MTLTPNRILTVLASLALSITMSAQNLSITGQVLDAANGEPIIGAGVIVSTGGGTVTDYDGKYVISAPAGSALTFSSLGYKEHKENVDGRTTIDVRLHPDNELLEEVVVLGYTTQKKAELSSSVVSMSGEKLHDVTTPDVGNMLQGKVAGVVVMNSSGQPGTQADIRIRGTGSITAGAGPLYVVDGVAGASFNPNDIETITVLKDASATALYGAAASGGVIVVTTKSGSQDNTQIEFKASAGIKKALTGRFHPMNSEEYYNYNKAMMSSALFNLKYSKDLLQRDFDWMNACFKTGIVQNYFASAAGKAGKVNYYVSLDHYNEQGSLINTNYRRNSARVNLSAPITDNLTIHTRINYAKTNDQGTSSWRTLEYAYYSLPWDVPYKMGEDGKFTNELVYAGSGSRDDSLENWYCTNPSNILHSEQYNYAKSHGESLTGDLQLVWNVTDWLTLTSINRYDTSWSYYEEYTDPRTFDGKSDNGYLSNSDTERMGNHQSGKVPQDLRRARHQRYHRLGVRRGLRPQPGSLRYQLPPGPARSVQHREALRGRQRLPEPFLGSPRTSSVLLSRKIRCHRFHTLRRELQVRSP